MQSHITEHIQCVVDNQQQLDEHVHYVMSLYSTFFSSLNDHEQSPRLRIADSTDSTSAYNAYNAFTLLSDNSEWRNVYADVSRIVKNFYKKQGGTANTLYLKAWINFNDTNSVLGWHTHDSLFHGYVSVTPHDTITQFDGFNVTNEVGKIYVGPGGLRHRVLVAKKYDSKRITIAFDVNDDFNALSNPLINIPISVK